MPICNKEEKEKKKQLLVYTWVKSSAFKDHKDCREVVVIVLRFWQVAIVALWNNIRTHIEQVTAIKDQNDTEYARWKQIDLAKHEQYLAYDRMGRNTMEKQLTLTSKNRMVESCSNSCRFCTMQSHTVNSLNSIIRLTS